MMDSLIDEFQELRLSALSKTKVLNSRIHDVTIGPDSTINRVDYNNHKERNDDIKVEDEHKPLRRSHDQYIQTAIYKRLTKQLEEDRLEKVHEAVNDHKLKFINFSKQIQERTSQEWSAKQKLLSVQMERQEVELLKKLEEYNKESKSQQQEQIEKYYQNQAEIRKQKEREKERLQLENENKSRIIEEIKKCEVDCQKVYERIIPLLGSCKKEVLEKHASQLNSIPACMSKICNDCSKGIITKEQVTSAKDMVRNIFYIYEQLKEAANEKAKQEVKVTQQEPVVSKRETSVENVDRIISESCSKTLGKLLMILQQTRQEYAVFEKDDSLKQFRFDCKKAINIPVNAISSASSKHLLDKYSKLSKLLSGNVVQIGDTLVNADSHKDGIKYCTDMLAQKFVLQGDLMISSNPDSAFCYATIILTLWNDFPLFGDLLLAHFYKQCPYLVPMYLIKINNQTDDDYYKSLGYKYNDDGSIEKQDKYLKRLTGTMRLYTALMITKPKSGQKLKTPFGLTNAWQWFSSMLNLPPKPDVTATLIHIFLQNVGKSMCNRYKKQFAKLMQFVNEYYMPILKKIDTGGPVTRLEGLLREYNQCGTFELPSGMLSDNFW